MRASPDHPLWKTYLAQLQGGVGTMGTLGSQLGCWAITLTLWLGDQ